MRVIGQRGLLTVVGALMLLASFNLAVASEAPATPAGAPLQTWNGTSRPSGGQVYRPDTAQRERWQQMDVTGIHGSERDLQIVVGPDSREQITDTTVYPYRAITQILRYDTHLAPGYDGSCTATFIGPSVLLTAAHCVYDPETFGGWVDDVRVIPGRNGNVEPFGTAWVSELWVPNGYIQDSSIVNPYDYALLKLDSSDLGNLVGQMQIGVLSDETLLAGDFNPTVSGYPGEMPDGTQWESSEPALTDLDATYLRHEIDLTPGQSGSAVRRGADQAIVGIVSFDTSAKNELNFAVRINDAVLNDLLAACDMLNCEFAFFIEDAVPQQDPLAAFARTWLYTDQPVAAGLGGRSWMWGPKANTDLLQEPYDEAPGGWRTVQYFDKSRMEDNSYRTCCAPWDVTNGLLVSELMTGRLQLGDNRFEQYTPSQANVAGDSDDAAGPTYTTFEALMDDTAGNAQAAIVQVVDRAGNISIDQSKTAYGIPTVHFVPETQHWIAGPFWDFMNSSGTVFVDGHFVTSYLFLNPYYATGFPISEPYWASVKVGGEYNDVLIQCFERRCLTYTPDNTPEWRVEMGNVGQHYYHWRYVEIPASEVAP